MGRAKPGAEVERLRKVEVVRSFRGGTHRDVRDGRAENAPSAPAPKSLRTRCVRLKADVIVAGRRGKAGDIDLAGKRLEVLRVLIP
jgi:hypothetical protein